MERSAGSSVGKFNIVKITIFLPVIIGLMQFLLIFL